MYVLQVYGRREAGYTYPGRLGGHIGRDTTLPWYRGGHIGRDTPPREATFGHTRSTKPPREASNREETPHPGGLSGI